MGSKPQRNPVLGRLDALVGEWEMQASIGGQELGGRARTAFEWIEDGAFLVQHAEAELPPEAPPELVENWPFPVTTIVGLDDSSERFCYAYADGRGVCRVYEMTLADGVWEIWGQSGPEFFQRFTGTFSDDGNTITARWEKSPNGSSWDLDFELTYTRVE
jgi:hypothetical protein